MMNKKVIFFAIFLIITLSIVLFFLYFPKKDFHENKILDVDIIVDLDSKYEINDKKIKEVFNLAADLLEDRSGVKMVNRQINYLSKNNKKIIDMVHEHLKNSVDWPEAVIVFSFGDDNFARRMGGYYRGTEIDKTDYCSEYKAGKNQLPILVVDWHNWYARCGYDENYNKVSAVSFGGQCQNTPNISCVIRQDKIYFICERNKNDLRADLDKHTAYIILHELFHGFDKRQGYHYGSPQCQKLLKLGQKLSDDYEKKSEENFGFCPSVYEDLKNSYNHCP